MRFCAPFSVLSGIGGNGFLGVFIEKGPFFTMKVPRAPAPPAPPLLSSGNPPPPRILGKKPDRCAPANHLVARALYREKRPLFDENALNLSSSHRTSVRATEPKSQKNNPERAAKSVQNSLHPFYAKSVVLRTFGRSFWNRRKPTFCADSCLSFWALWLELRSTIFGALRSRRK